MARRRYQTGTVFLKANKKVNLWVGRFKEDEIQEDGNTKRVRRAVILGTKAEYPTEKLARRALEVHLARINSPEYRPGRMATLEDFAERWKAQALALRKPSYVHAAESHLKVHILPILGRCRLDQLGPETQQTLINRLNGKVSRKMLANVLGTLSSMLNRAKDWGYICEGVQKRKLVMPDRGIKKAVRVFTPDECKKILVAAVNPYRSMYALAAMTGMRIGEILGLCWEDVIFASATITVRQTVWRGKVQTAKTVDSENSLPMPAPLSTILQSHLKEWKPNSYGLLFVNSRSTPWIAENIVRDYLGPLLASLKIPHGGFHAFRHAHSSLLIDGGASVKVTQEQLRHSDPRITIGRYSHVIGDARRAAVEQLAAQICDSNGLQENDKEVVIQ